MPGAWLHIIIIQIAVLSSFLNAIPLLSISTFNNSTNQLGGNAAINNIPPGPDNYDPSSSSLDQGSLDQGPSVPPYAVPNYMNFDFYNNFEKPHRFNDRVDLQGFSQYSASAQIAPESSDGASSDGTSDGETSSNSNGDIGFGLNGYSVMQFYNAADVDSLRPPMPPNEEIDFGAQSLLYNGPVVSKATVLSNYSWISDALPLRDYQELGIPTTSDLKLNPSKVYRLNFTYGISTADCYPRSLVMINGYFPGPAITVFAGETFSVIIDNQLDSTAVTLHLHGIYQIGSPYYDGTAGVSQVSVAPNTISTFHYKVVGQSGTFWYHAHNDMLAHLIYGPLIVYNATRNEKEIYGYDDERTLVFGDYWRNKNAQAMSLGLTNKTFSFVGDPDSLLMNGHTIGDVSSYNETHMFADPANSTCFFSTITVEPLKTYRLRIIAASSLSYLQFKIDSHKMTLIEADGTLVEPREIETLEINSGQRYSVLLTANQPPNLYWMYMQAAWRPNTPKNGYSVLRYVNFNDESLPQRYMYPKKLSLPGEVNGGYLWKFLRQDSRFTVETMPSENTHFLKLDANQQLMNGYLRWSLNNVSLQLLEVPSLLSMYMGVADKLPEPSRPIMVPLESVVDVVIQNHVTTSGICEQHALHLHGHSFWDVDSGPGTYVQGETAVNFSNPLFRDVTTMYGWNYTYWISSEMNRTFTPQTPCGWKYIRIYFNNPGSWLFHCHASSHLSMGFGKIFQVGTKEDLPPVPINFPWLIPKFMNAANMLNAIDS